MHFAEPPSGLAEWLQAEPTQQMSMHRRSSQRQPLASDSPSVQARGAGAGSGRRMHAEGPPGTAGWAQPAFSPQQMSKQAPPLRQVQPLSRRSPGSQALGGATGVARSGGAGAGASSFAGSTVGGFPSGSGGREQASASRVARPVPGRDRRVTASHRGRCRSRLSDRSGPSGRRRRGARRPDRRRERTRRAGGPRGRRSRSPGGPSG